MQGERVMNIIEEIEKEQIAKLTAQRSVPEFAPGDTLRVSVKVIEGTRERVQAFAGAFDHLHAHAQGDRRHPRTPERARGCLRSPSRSRARCRRVRIRGRSVAPSAWRSAPFRFLR